MFRLSGLYFAFLPRSAAFVESFPPLFRGGRRGPEICRGRNPQRPEICRRAESAEAGRRGEREAAGESPGNASMFRTGAAGRRRRRRKSGGMAGGVAEKGGTGRKPAEVRLDILPRLKSGDSQRRQSCDCVPERVPASPRLPRGTRLGFRRKHSHVGNFTGTNQPPIPPGLTISPQADTACPAAVSPVSKQRQESQNSS